MKVQLNLFFQNSHFNTTMVFEDKPNMPNLKFYSAERYAERKLQEISNDGGFWRGLIWIPYHTLTHAHMTMIEEDKKEVDKE